jgi:small-conductance mechanosensitive channel
MKPHYPILELMPWTPAWLIVLGLTVAAIAIALVAHAILFAILQRIPARSSALWHAIILRSRAVARYALIIVSLSLMLPATPLAPNTIDSAHKVLLAAFIVFLGWAAIIALNLALDRYTQHFKLDVDDNLQTRKAVTQIRVFKQALDAALVVLTAGFALMSFDSVRQFGISLFASAGVAGIAAGLAARPVLGNLIAGMQIAVTQPIRLDDVLVINGQWGTVEEITSTYVVMKLWDWRRYIVPLSYFFDNPFENWTRVSANLIGTVFVYADYTIPVQKVRDKLDEIAKQSKLWDGQVVNLQVSDAKDNVIELRALVSAKTSPMVWDLRCEVREKLITFLQQEFPGSLPRQRGDISFPNGERPFPAAKREFADGKNP